jgi:hypothetical protein
MERLLRATTARPTTGVVKVKGERLLLAHSNAIDDRFGSIATGRSPLSQMRSPQWPES